MASHSLHRSFAEIPKLKGKTNWVEWEIRIQVALGKAGLKAFLRDQEPVKAGGVSEEEKAVWNDQDVMLANCILDTTDFAIRSAHYHLLEASSGQDGLSRLALAVFNALKATYGTSNAQYAFSLARRFIDSHCGEEDDVNLWINEVLAQFRELATMQYSLDSLCVNVLLHGLPERFNGFTDTVWSSATTPTVESVSDAILRINAGHQHRRQTEDEGELRHALYVRRQGKQKGKPSAASPCHNCGSHRHWAAECPEDKPHAASAQVAKAAKVANLLESFNELQLSSSGFTDVEPF